MTCMKNGQIPGYAFLEFGLGVDGMGIYRVLVFPFLHSIYPPDAFAGRRMSCCVMTLVAPSICSLMCRHYISDSLLSVLDLLVPLLAANVLVPVRAGNLKDLGSTAVRDAAKSAYRAENLLDVSISILVSDEQLR